MKKILGALNFLKTYFPTDIRLALTSFALSSLVMSTALFSLFHVLKSEISESQTHDFKKCGLEPYIESQIDFSLPTSATLIELGTAEDTRAELLARAINMAVPDESYAVRVSFGAVLLNREANDAFPSSLAAVIRSAELYPESFDGKLPDRTVHAARDALLGVDPTMGALYVMRTDDASYSAYESRVSAIYGDYAFIK